ncbi:ABC transporter related protein [Fibrisoma limi BUZ 3]|uniref:ABC transporter related protein n=1 Tax=Fibrisoma limi BUZ 3 TaxID=1185876 RepID=I2GPI8_9BACT|nr:ABC transporter ATP-binding protein [Fibrisoma limi]CCH55816.1 ABC transporter related protein [Fibrisoma limi BUZ 3]
MIAQLINANKLYRTGDQTITALSTTSLQLNEGELLLIIGPSGSGKTTLLSLLGCLINPTEGKLLIAHQDVNQLSAREMATLRLNTIGFVFQQFNLLAPLTAEQNVAFPLKMQRLPAAEINRRTLEALEKVRMTHRRKNLPRTLSGGEQQRIAIARALVTDPKLVLCDEPTASLDKDSLDVVMEELKNLTLTGKSVAVVTHDPRLQRYADRAVQVKNGVVSQLGNQPADLMD